MTDPRAPRHGRHAAPAAGGGIPGGWPPATAQGSSHDPGNGWPETAPGFPAPRPTSHATPSSWSPEETAAWTWNSDDPRWDAPPASRRVPGSGGAHAAHADRGGFRRTSGLLERWPDETGPLPADATGPLPEGGDGPRLPEWRHRPGDEAEPESEQPGDGRAGVSGPPLPPRPSGPWSRLQRRGRRAESDPSTVEHDVVGPGAHRIDDRVDGRADDHADDVDTHHLPAGWEDRTGGLDVIGAHVDGRGDADLDARGFDERGFDEHGDDHTGPLALHDEDIPVAPYDRRARRRRRRPFAVLVALLALAGLGIGIVFGGQKLIGLFVARDYTGPGTGTVQIRVHQGDTLSDIGQTLVAADVVASVRPFVKAAEKDPRATGIAPGVYALHHRMSGQAAVRLLLDPKARLVTRVTIPEGLTAKKTLERLAQATGVPLEQLQAAAADPTAIGLPAYANGQVEGFLFPATYDFEPNTTPAGMLKAMVARAVQTLDQLGIPADRRLATVTEASIVQAEAGSIADMPKVARVLANRLAKGMPLQLDTTVNYANGKSGITTTPQDRANSSPYNTYLHPGLPPGPISNPGEEALRASLNPTPGDWLYFVVVNPDTGETRFAATAQEHQQNVLLFQAWLRAHPNG